MAESPTPESDPGTAPDDERPRTGFGPVVLAGLASAGLAAVAGTRAWVEGTSGQLSTETAGDAAVVGSAVADQLKAASGADTADVHLTGWYAAACVAAVGCVLTTLLAVRLVPAWPEMGRRYDAPAGEAAPPEPQGNLEIWKALDEGHDPTDRQRPLD